MPQSAVVTILGVEAKSGTGKNGKPYTIHRVKASDGNTYDTFDAPLYQAAVQAGGAPVVLEFETRQNGEYTNYDLKGVTLAGNGVHAAVANPVVVENASGAGVIQSAGAQDNSAAQPSDFAQRKDARITRLSAASTALSYAGAAGLGIEEALVLADQIEYFANHGLTIPAPTAVAVAAVPAQDGAAPMPWDDAA